MTNFIILIKLPFKNDYQLQNEVSTSTDFSHDLAVKQITLILREFSLPGALMVPWAKGSSWFGHAGPIPLQRVKITNATTVESIAVEGSAMKQIIENVSYGSFQHENPTLFSDQSISKKKVKAPPFSHTLAPWPFYFYLFYHLFLVFVPITIRWKELVVNIKSAFVLLMWHNMCTWTIMHGQEFG